METKYSSQISLPPLKFYLDFLSRHNKIISICTLLGMIIGLCLAFALPYSYKSNAAINTGSIESDKFTSATKSLELFRFHLQKAQIDSKDMGSDLLKTVAIFETAFVNKSDNGISLQSTSKELTASQQNLTKAGDSFIKFLNSRHSISLQKFETSLTSETNQIKQIDESLKLINSQIIMAKSTDALTYVSLLLLKNNLLIEKIKAQDSASKILLLIQEINNNPAYYLKKPTDPRVQTPWYLRIFYALIAGFTFGIFLGLLSDQHILRTSALFRRQL